MNTLSYGHFVMCGNWFHEKMCHHRETLYIYVKKFVDMKIFDIDGKHLIYGETL